MRVMVLVKATEDSEQGFRPTPEAREMLDLARAGKVPPVPIAERPLAAAQTTLDDLRNGAIVGRVVLTM